jgi:hypothetical protein
LKRKIEGGRDLESGLFDERVILLQLPVFSLLGMVA